jgi:DNA-binding phage protein
MSDRKLGPQTEIATHLTEPRLRAVYLSDALATGQDEEVAHALHMLRHKGRLTKEAAKEAEDWTLAEVMDVLRDAGVQLVAIRRPDA